MASTPYGAEIQDYINEELRHRGIEAAAAVVEGQNNFDYGVHIRGAVLGQHFFEERLRDWVERRSETENRQPSRPNIAQD